MRHHFSAMRSKLEHGLIVLGFLNAEQTGDKYSCTAH
jgi:hypothetical protein